MASQAAPGALAVPPHNSLVKYDNPILVSTVKDPAAKSRGKGAVKERSTATEDILNSILPPREWTHDGQLWVQYVSSTPATTSDVMLLQEQLDQRLQQRQARETGICPVREELYAQCFDEIIRQVTINCAERGLLLLRIRDELRMTVAAYQTLYESSIAYGMRKALHSEHSRSELEAAIRQLEGEVAELTGQVDATRQKVKGVEERERAREAAENERHSAEVAALRGRNAELKAELETLLSVSSPAQPPAQSVKA